MLVQLLVAFVLCLPGEVQAGCYQRRMCCPGRNLSCTAIDDGIDHLPFRPVMPQAITTTSTTTTTTAETIRRTDRAQYPTVYDDRMQRIGQLVYPDVIEVEGSGTDFYEKYGNRVPLDVVSIEPMQIVELGTTVAPTFKRIVFGEAFFPSDQLTEMTRYSLLNQHIPITIGEFADYDEAGSVSKIMYLESDQEHLCYCDEMCISFGDCCSDYTFVCPPSDCYVSNWSDWSDCVADDDQQKCGIGVKTRTREIMRGPRFGGAECPPLVEKMSCFQECLPKTQDITTVALLLDYKYSGIREKLARDNIYWDLPEVAGKVEKLSYYCVSYEIGWVNKNCVDKKITAKLHTGNIICAECQPEAQLHRNNMRCASDLDDGEYGFWKLIGPKSCNGIWTRLSRVDNCKCETYFPKNDSYLIV
ncbi:Somatomedin-B and thrombospondin type-1 domain-containing protein [Toxocara canis]|uniref:Somatomedin-B and thrombospondin type-1 domain-containing protein n=1 Tax=Toxocara canis TaxID=6265 RepID=A0A0B2UT43_TOXCA|nr:Somatomedin-B and thrombospondin type-1 domain-containing protein [Toxocara canis]